MSLVTGATGNVGSGQVPRLLAAGESVRVLVRDLSRAAHLASEMERVIGDLDKPEPLTDARCGVRAVYLISQAGHVGRERSLGICSSRRPDPVPTPRSLSPLRYAGTSLEREPRPRPM